MAAPQGSTCAHPDRRPSRPAVQSATLRLPEGDLSRGTEIRSPPPRERTLAARLLLLVGAAYVVTQLIVVPVDRAPGWDESIYISQVSPDAPALRFVASRARGITFLVAPALWAGGSVTAVRLFLVVASAVGLVVAARLWIPLIGLAAPLAAVLVGFSWLALAGGSDVIPNLPAAILGLAAAGSFARHLSGTGGRWALPASAALIALVAFVRPPDSLPIAAALLIVAVALDRRSSRSFGAAPARTRRSSPVSARSLAPIGAGLLLGWAPWLIEMSVRNGGPIGAFRAAGAVGHVGAGSAARTVFQHLSLTDGPNIGPEQTPTVPALGVLWWGGLATLTAVALLRSRRGPASAPLVLGALASIGLAMEYLVFVSGLAPRFLLPAYALLSIPTAAGLMSLWRTGPVVRVAAVALLGVWLVLQVNVAVHARDGTRDASLRAAGLVVRELAAGRRCHVASTDGFPQVGLASGCRAAPLEDLEGDTLERLERLDTGGNWLFVVTGTAPPPGSPLAGVAPARTVSDWLVYEI